MATPDPLPSIVPQDAQPAGPLISAADPKHYDVSPSEAIVAIASHEGPVLVDLDETLYLSNTTEDFIDLARPGLLAIIGLRLLDIIEPWRLTGGEPSRDVWRVRLICLFFPWTLWRWNRRAKQLAARFANEPLLEALRQKGGEVIIVTMGFGRIVTPVVAAWNLPGVRIVAARLDTFADRRRGKLEFALEELGEPILLRSLLITDSLLDLPMLQRCARPIYTVWPDARFRNALRHVYFPGQYISQVKRPGGHYFRRAILQEDYAAWVLCSIALAPAAVPLIFGLLLLLISFWIMYECGYVDNDLMAAQRERDPELTGAFHESPVATPFWQPWIWAAASGAAGVYVLRLPGRASLEDYLRWTAVLLATYGWFLLYNRSEKNTRVWMFSVLQFARATAFMVLVPILPIGAMALGAHVIARWTPYYLYRLHGKNWPGGTNVGIIRALFFLILALLLGATEGWKAVANWSALALAAWMLMRAAYDIKELRARRSR
jgi:haloacid dehalogenase-like hydrolase